MANTYTQLYVHYIFAVQNRQSLINNNIKEDVCKYISGIIEQQGHKVFAINGMPDHLHILVSMNPVQAPSEMMFHIKRSSSLWINKNKLTGNRFRWQEGFGAFSYGRSQIPIIAGYIERQQIHHRKKTFYEEYTEFLKAFDVEYDERYILKPV
jgi:putative transposase